MNEPSNKLTLASALKAPSYAKRFEEVLGRRAPQFLSSVLQVGRSLGDDCEPLSIIGGAMTAASLDLPINKSLGFAWLVPFNEKDDMGKKRKVAQFQIGYKGYIQLALRTKQYRRMNAGPVNAEAVGGFDSVGERIIDFSKLDRTKPAAGYFFAFELIGGGLVKVCYWSKEEVEDHAKQYSQSFRGGYNSPWKTHFDSMATKTVIANELRRWGIMSVEMVEAITKDQGVITDIKGETMIEFPDNPQLPESADDGDIGPQTATEQAAPVSVTASLEAIVSSAGHSFDKFRKWAIDTGQDGINDSMGSFDEIPTATATRLIKAQAGMLRQLGAVK